jgi:hypothetical protein
MWMLDASIGIRPCIRFEAISRLPNAQLSDSVQVQQLMTMGTGILDIPFLQYADHDSPEHHWNSLHRLPITAPPETECHHNNTIQALGGYVERWLRAFPFPTCWTRTFRL